MAELVTSVDCEATTVELVNLSPETERAVIVQAGAFAEHTITTVRYTTCQDDGWIGDMYDHSHTEPVVTETEAANTRDTPAPTPTCCRRSASAPKGP